MEIEAKYIVPDKTAANRLSRVDQLEPFTLRDAVQQIVRDTFFDTRAHDLINTRHVLRLRTRNDGRAFLTLKAPSQTAGAIHQRPETEVAFAVARMPRVLYADELPRRIKTLLAPLVTDDKLYPLFSISQRRLVRDLKIGRKTIAEWSLDHVRFRAGDRKREFYELEIELKKTGTNEELKLITARLELEYGLQPQSQSKFRRGLDFISEG